MPFRLEQDTSSLMADVSVEMEIAERMARVPDRSKLPDYGFAVKTPRRWDTMLDVGSVKIISDSFRMILEEVCPDDVFLHALKIRFPGSEGKETVSYSILKPRFLVDCLDFERSGGRVKVTPDGRKLLQGHPSNIVLLPATVDGLGMWLPKGMEMSIFISDELAARMQAANLKWLRYTPLEYLAVARAS
jgi:hypothetical protein